MVAHTLPCAEKNCNSQMTLIENKEKTLGYSCLKNPDEHNFKYYIDQKRWKKIIINTKLILHYNKNPYEDTVIQPSNLFNRIKKTPINSMQEPKKFMELTTIKGIGPKRAQELNQIGVKTVSDLAKTSPKYLSEKTGISIEQISNWIIEANKRVEKEVLITV